ncbi:hypothetical protein [Alienimonas chondri]|uniref:Cytochrome c domain-containing protein n=1 Tax=Alienimonas chondri TaxID=2681879 RepID=A0ABX1V7T5_9PLAN|nr:hypothetical protein [Alienimonas chondri]NNJ24007.1 hypothetical protein [Alienimonas chondri]
MSAFLLYLPAGIAAVVLIWIAARVRSAYFGWTAATTFGVALLLCGFNPGLGAIPHTLGALSCGFAVAMLRACGVKPKWAAAGVGATFMAACAVDAGRFYASEYRPWLAEVTEQREAHPAVPRSTRLPRTEPVVAQSAPYRSDEKWDQYFSETEPSWHSDERPGDGFRRVMGRLHSVHTDFADRFAQRMGFGIHRMPQVQWELREFKTFPAAPTGSERIRQPSGVSGEDPKAATAVIGTERAAIAAWHRERGIDFANEAGFGAFGDRGPGYGDLLPKDFDPASGEGPFLIGFESHAAQTAADEEPLPGWSLTGFELIGLILHDEPVAYQSDYLPIAGPNAPHNIRPLTDFEAKGLARLAMGEWVYAEADAERFRAVGALTAATACADCHAVEEGRLLGALSYEFLRSPSAEGIGPGAGDGGID